MPEIGPRVRRWGAAGAVALALACGPAPAAAGDPPVPLIPRETLLKLGGGGFAPRLSPDGRHIAYIRESDEGVPNIWVRTLGLADDRMVTRDRRSGIFRYQ